MKYRTHVFDCDGVLLDSNKVKSDAFYQAALPYGEEAARALVAYHQTAGSIGRDARFAYFFASILGRPPRAGETEGMLHRCTEHILEGTLKADKVAGIEEYLAGLEGRLFVVSGIDTTELLVILSHHGLRRYFDRIYGGPRTKGLILSEIRGEITRPALYYGDTEDDYRCARVAGLHFVFVAGCSEWQEGRAFCKAQGIDVIEDFTQQAVPA